MTAWVDWTAMDAGTMKMGKMMRVRYTLPMVVFLLGTDTCTPVLPEADPIISSSPDVVRTLRAEHADILPILSKYETGSLIPIATQSVYFEQLAIILSAIPESVALTSATLQISDELHSFCDKPSFLLYTVGVTTKSRLFRRSRSHQLEFLVCGQDLEMEVVPVPVHKVDESPILVDTQRVGEVLVANFQLMMDDVNDYMVDVEFHQHAILAGHLGCPEGARYDHNEILFRQDSNRQHWCVRNGLRHGPYVEGALSPLLEGVRVVEGQFVDGMQDGHWVYRDTAGTVTEQSWWASGQRVSAPIEP